MAPAADPIVIAEATNDQERRGTGMMSDPPPALPAHLMQHKKIGELENRNEQLKARLGNARAEENAATRRYAELEREGSAALPPSDDQLLRRIQNLLKGRTDALEAAARLRDVRQTFEQRRARWRQLLKQVLRTLQHPESDGSDAKQMMATAAGCADCLAQEEEHRFGAVEAVAEQSTRDP